MSGEEARRMVQALAKHYDAKGPGLNEKGYGGVMMGKAQVFFELREKEGELEALGHIFTFRKEPKPEVLAAFGAEAKAGAPTGGGVYKYTPENMGLFLSRTYRQAPDEATFLAQMKELAEASLFWRDQVFPRAMDKAFGRAPAAH